MHLFNLRRRRNRYENLEIRRAKISDFESYYNLWLQMEKQHQYEFWTKLRRELYGIKFDKHQKLRLKKRFVKDLKDDNVSIMVGLINKIIVGFIDVRCKNLYSDKRGGIILDLAVDKKYRNNGVATKLRDKGYEWFKLKKISYVQIRYDPKNKLAEKIYKNWGFETDMIEMITKLK